MPHYTVTRKSDQAEVSRYAAGAVSLLDQWPLETHEHTEFDPDVGVVPVTTSVRISRLAFRNRFTTTEKATLEIAAVHNAALASNHQSNLLAASLRASFADQRDASFIDLLRPDTRGGVLVLEQYGLIAAGRATVILDTPPTESEVWNG